MLSQSLPHAAVCNELLRGRITAQPWKLSGREGELRPRPGPKSRWDSSVSKGSCHGALWSEVGPHYPFGRRRESLTGWPLIFTCASQHMPAHIHTQINIKFNMMMMVMVEVVVMIPRWEFFLECECACVSFLHVLCVASFVCFLHSSLPFHVSFLF